MGELTNKEKELVALSIDFGGKHVMNVLNTVATTIDWVMQKTIVVESLGHIDYIHSVLNAGATDQLEKKFQQIVYLFQRDEDCQVNV